MISTLIMGTAMAQEMNKDAGMMMNKDNNMGMMHADKKMKTHTMAKKHAVKKHAMKKQTMKKEMNKM